MKEFEITAKSIMHLILAGNAEEAVSLLRQAGDSPVNSLPIHYFLLLAQAEHYVNNQPKAIDIYRYVISTFPNELSIIFGEMVIHAPEMPEIYSVIEKLIETAEDESIYSILRCSPQALTTTKQLSLYQQRVSFICEILEKKNIPIKTALSMNNILTQHVLLEKNQNDFVMRKRLAKLCGKNVEALVTQDFVKATPKEKIKVGICITRYDKIDFQTILVSLFQGFDASKFELIFFGAKAYEKNANFSVLNRLFAKVVIYDEHDWKSLQSLLIQEKLDVFLAENVGDCASTFAFFSRVAPIQCNIVDRLLSFGAPFIDYYICFGEKDAYKQWDATKFDHEKYVILEDTYVCSAPSNAVATPWDLKDIGLPEGAKFIFYPQTLPRMLPEDDYIVKTLLESNPQLYFVALSHIDAFKFIWYRWKKIMPDCMDRIIFMPPQSQSNFLWIVSQASLVLGAFKGGHGVVTLSTVFSQGQPVLAGHGDCFASSFSRFYYAKMGVEGLLANSHEEAVQIGQRLLDDPKWKAEKSAEITANLHEIYKVKDVSLELQSFILQAYDRAAKGLAAEYWEHGKFIN